jgi:KUP system potassium uptake protein
MSAALPDGAAGGKSTSAKVKLAVGAIGIVFGDIGTSPIYAFRETFVGPHPLTLDTLHLMGVVSLIFWAMTIIVSLQYVAILMRADNKGQGGTLALVALISRKIGGTNRGWIAVMLGVFATSLFYGDSMITPAVSVLSAVEGLTTVEESLGEFVIPIALALLIALFLLQKRGTATIGRLFSCWSISRPLRCSASSISSIFRGCSRRLTPGTRCSFS